MEVKPGYKQTEVGVIPEDWEVRRLKELFTIKSGFAFSSAHFSDKGPILLTPGNFRLDGGLYFNERNTKHYSGSYAPLMVFGYGDLLVVMTDLTPDCNLLGKPAFVRLREPILHNQRIGKIVPTGSRLSLVFLYWYFLSDPHAARMKETATGSTVRHTSNSSIYGTLIALPPTKAEQEAIAEALSDADALIESLEKLLAKKRQIKQGAMQELLTGKKRLPGFEIKPGYKQTEVGVIPEDWEVRRIDTVCRLISSHPGTPVFWAPSLIAWTIPGCWTVAFLRFRGGFGSWNSKVVLERHQSSNFLTRIVDPELATRAGEPVPASCNSVPKGAHIAGSDPSPSRCSDPLQRHA